MYYQGTKVVLFLEVTNVLSLWEGDQGCPLFRGCPLLRGDKCIITMGRGPLYLKAVLSSEGRFHCITYHPIAVAEFVVQIGLTSSQ